MRLKYFLRRLINFTIDLIINQSVFRVGNKIVPKLAQTKPRFEFVTNLTVYFTNLQVERVMDQLNKHWPRNIQQHPKKKRKSFAKGKKS